MSVVQIGGQDFVLQAPRSSQLIDLNNTAIRSSTYSQFVSVQTPRSLALVNYNNTAIRTSTYRRFGSVQALRPLALINFNDASIRASAYKHLDLILLGPFRPKPRPKTGYTYPRRTHL